MKNQRDWSMKTEFLLLGIAQARFGFNPGAYSYRNVFENKNFQAIFLIKKYQKHAFSVKISLLELEFVSYQAYVEILVYKIIDIPVKIAQMHIFGQK